MAAASWRRPAGAGARAFLAALLGCGIAAASFTGPPPALGYDAARDSLPVRSERDPARLIAGLLPCTAELEARWPPSRTWVFPVGDSLMWGKGAGGKSGYRVNRGLLTRDADGTEHDGADLANGSPGGFVRAAASGVVVTVEPSSRGGYGSYVVLAHHLRHCTLVYTVYSHLLAGSTRVAEGAIVHAGEWIARVGQTGRATTPHLHFEVRVPRDSTLRWEHCAVVDPVAFIVERMAEAREDAGWAVPYQAWAERAEFIPRGLNPAAPLDADLLSVALGHLGIREPQFNDESSESRGRDIAGWKPIAQALSSLNARRNRLPPCGIDPGRTARTCSERLGVKHPASNLHSLARRTEPPTVGELCLALADFAARPPSHGLPTRKHRGHR